jgi:hypothetical protein
VTVTTGSTCCSRAAGEREEWPVLREEVRHASHLFSDGAPNTIRGQFVAAAGGTVSGNLYSQTAAFVPQWIYDPAVYNDAQRFSGGGTFCPITGPLPTGGGDPSFPVPLASYRNLRTLSGGVTAAALHCDVNRAARNMVENVANMVRNQGIYVFTLGFGDSLRSNEVEDCGYGEKEYGANILRRLANTPDSDTYNRLQPSGVYCEAPTVAQLRPCFEQIASALLRITR